jgi:hypothetical protein
VTKLKSDGSALIYSTFLAGPGGGSVNTSVTGVAVDTTGNAYLTGPTSAYDFPTTAGAFEAANGSGGVNSFVTKLNPGGTGLVYSTLITGGSVSTSGIAIDTAGNAYVVGSAYYLTYPGVVKYGSGGGGDIVVLKLNSSGTAAVYASMIGGQSEDDGTGIALDPSGNVFVSGTSRSSDFPAVAPFQGTDFLPDGFFIAAAVEVDSTGHPVFSSFVEGPASSAVGVGVDGNGVAYVAGQAGNYAFATPGAANSGGASRPS